MGLSASLHTLAAALRVRNERVFSVVILTRDERGDQPALNCAMAESQFVRLQAEWLEAIEKDRRRAGCYWMTVTGQSVRHGIILNNIFSITGVPEGEGQDE